MSTRCNIKVTNGENVIWLYRHSDGYLSEAGHNIVCTLSFAKNAYDFVKTLLEQKYPATEYRKQQSIYEYTNSRHGDIEFLYEIDFKTFTETNNFTTVQVKIKKRLWDDTQASGTKWVLVHNQTIDKSKGIKAFQKQLPKVFEEYKASQDKMMKAYGSLAAA